MLAVVLAGLIPRACLLFWRWAIVVLATLLRAGFGLGSACEKPQLALFAESQPIDESCARYREDHFGPCLPLLRHSTRVPIEKLRSPCASKTHESKYPRV